MSTCGAAHPDRCHIEDGPAISPATAQVIATRRPPLAHPIAAKAPAVDPGERFETPAQKKEERAGRDRGGERP